MPLAGSLAQPASTLQLYFWALAESQRASSNASGLIPKILGAKVSTGRAISSVCSPSPARWSFPNADTSLSETETVSAWQGCTGELLRKLKCHKVFKKSVWIFSMNHMEIIVEKK